MSAPLIPYFQDFLKRISLTQGQRKELIKNHTTLRERLEQDYEISPLIEEIFLQGSYKRNTIVRHKDGKHSDVDIVVVLKLDKNKYSPDDAIQIFTPFLREHYKGWCRRQTHSWGIKLPNVHMDLIPAVSPYLPKTNILFNNDISRWKREPLYIPNRKEDKWQKTDPLHINRWTRAKNERCNGHFTDVVKCIKWWRRVQSPSAKRLKGYPLEYLVGQCCPDGITSVEEGIVRTFNNMVTYCWNATISVCRQLPGNNVFEGMSNKQYNEFDQKLCEAADIANRAYNAKKVKEAVELWSKLLGDQFGNI